jgi:hypothetical protein
VTEFQSRRELREAERQGLVPKPEQVFDLPTGSIRLPEPSELLTRKRIREMEREGLLDPLTGSLSVAAVAEAEVVQEQRAYDEVMAETEEPITSSISAVGAPAGSETNLAPASSVEPATRVAPDARVAPAPVAATDIFHSMAVDPSSRKPKIGIVIAVILVLLGGASAAAYMLGIFK